MRWCVERWVPHLAVVVIVAWAYLLHRAGADADHYSRCWVFPRRDVMRSDPTIRPSRSGTGPLTPPSNPPAPPNAFANRQWAVQWAVTVSNFTAPDEPEPAGESAPLEAPSAADWRLAGESAHAPKPLVPIVESKPLPAQQWRVENPVPHALRAAPAETSAPGSGTPKQ